ncbi:MAG: caspase family protein [Spirochaetes bacterium]|nr:caspase family protein [Spirochaetota bacterium]
MLYALLVGINDYLNPEIPPLQGCIHDVNSMKNFLERHIGEEKTRIQMLLNQDAIYANLIAGFREHLIQAEQGDLVLFYYSGHGTQVGSAPEFEKYFPGGKDEALVCHDSLAEDGFTLTDKELAVLVSEIAEKKAEIVLIMDCCHSGSLTRAIKQDKKQQVRVRFTSSHNKQRTLESYLYGYFKKRQLDSIPRSQHLLMAGCEKTQTAKELNMDGQPSGIFTKTLIKILSLVNGQISYSDLFTQCRAQVKTIVMDQDPQFEKFEHFDPHKLFLSKKKIMTKRYSIRFNQGNWMMEHGLVYGMPNTPEKPVDIAIYSAAPGDEERIGYAEVCTAGMKISEITLEEGVELDKEKTYKGEIISLPVHPLNVYVHGDKNNIEKLIKLFPDYIHKVSEEIPSQYGVEVKHNAYRIYNRNNQTNILYEKSFDSANIQQIYFLTHQLTKIENWERLLKLTNQNAQLDYDHFSVVFSTMDKEYWVDGSLIELVSQKQDEQWQDFPFSVKVKNDLNRNLFCCLLYFGKDFSISGLYNDKIVMNSDFIVIDDEHKLGLPDDLTIKEVTDHFMIVISTESLDSFVYEQPGVSLYKEEISRDLFKKPRIKNDWYIKHLWIKTIRGH